MSGLTLAAVERFKADLSALIGEGRARLGVAVSGGPDSLALLMLAHAAFPGDVMAATVDHGLRAESADEAVSVAAICADHSIPHETLRPATPISGSTQAAARVARYALLEQWRAANAINWIATGHHVDDQAETLLMRLNRGAGVAGLAGVRAMNGQIIRPLLGWRRAELAIIVSQSGLSPIDDPSNRDPKYDRVRIRSALAQADWLNAENIATCAALLAEAHTALEWASRNIEHERLVRGSESVKMDPSLLPRELRRRLTLSALRHIDPAIAPRGTALVELIEALGRGETRTLGGVLCKGGATWRFSRAAPRQKK